MAMGENRLINFRKERDGSRQRLLVYIFLFFLIFIISDNNAWAEEELPTIGNPGNTTINFFDYYVYDASGNQTVNYYRRYNSGINEDHTLWFHTNTEGNPIWNYWPKYEGGVTQGIVQPILGADGFPVLNCGEVVTQFSQSGKVEANLQCVQENESLAYLFQVPEDYVPADPFDPSDPNLTRNDSAGRVAWQAYPGVNKLFLVDENGKYVFNSQYHKALMDRDEGQIHVYKHTTTDSKKYGFYPFSATGERPDTNGDKSGWLFGAHIHTDFSVPYNYKVKNQNGEYYPMIYNFIGDDDVWVYIDGVLIGDIGGIHSRHNLSINFETGDITIKNTDKPSTNTTLHTTIWEMALKAFDGDWQEALAYFEEKGITWKIEGYEADGTPIIKTFAGSTYHTLDFFYLERGAGGSNMEMEFNLVSTYDFTAHKSLHRGSSQGDAVLQRDQFRYRLTGFPETYDGAVMEAIMPKKAPTDPVIWIPDYDPANKSLVEEPILSGPKTLVVGNSPDGNVNFGNGDMDRVFPSPVSEFEQYVGKTFRYIIEELPPEGAVPAGGDYLYQGNRISPLEPGGHVYIFDGVEYDLSEKLPPPGAAYQGSYNWNGESVGRNDDGTYTFDGITYDNNVFYFTGTLSDQGWINKAYYTDDSYSVRKNVSFAGFNNLYDSVGQANLKAYKEYFDADDDRLQPGLNQFSFKLTDVTDPASPRVIQPLPGELAPSNSGDGSVSFDPIFYSLAEDIPAGQATVYTYKIEEIPGDDPKINYSGEAYYVRVLLTDAGSGKLSVDIKYYKDPECSVEQEVPEEQVIFRNKENVLRTLTVDKYVTGNLGSRNKPFAFTLAMPEMEQKTVQSSMDGGVTYDLVEFDEEGKASFNLKHSESITFYGIHGAYELVEVTDGGYSTTWHSSDDPATETSGKTAKGAVTLADNNVTVTYTNGLEVPPPTGIREELMPALAGIAAGGTMLLMMLTGNKRKENG